MFYNILDSNEEVMPSAETAFTEKDDDIICDAVVQKAQVEVVDLSSDDEDQTTNGRQFVTAYIQGVPSRKVSNVSNSYSKRSSLFLHNVKKSFGLGKLNDQKRRLTIWV